MDDKRTPDELTERAQKGDHAARCELWEAVRRYALKLAYRWDGAFHGRNGVTISDLENSAFCAMADAVEGYSRDRGAFLTWYTYHLKTAFCVCYGVRRRTGDPLDDAVSLDSPLSDEPDAGTLLDTLTDPAGELPLLAVEDRQYQTALRAALEEALDKLPEVYSYVLRRRYFDGCKLAEVGAEIDRPNSRVYAIEKKAFQVIRRSSSAPQLLELYDFDYYHGTGYGAFYRSGSSVQERYLLNLERAQRQYELEHRNSTRRH